MVESGESRGGEMADAPALGAGGRKPVQVQVLSSAQTKKLSLDSFLFAEEASRLLGSRQDLNAGACVS